MIAPSLPDRLSTKVRMIERRFSSSGMAIRSMKKAGSLETPTGLDNRDEHSSDRLFVLDRLEGPIAPRAITRTQPRDTQFRYFLDAVQKTLPVWRIGLVPVIVSYAVTGVLERDDTGESGLLPGSLKDRHVWLIPLRTGVRAVDDLVRMLEDDGEVIIDPIEPREEAGFFNPNYDLIAGQYNRIVDCAYAAARSNRAELEREALRAFQENPHKRYRDTWMVVDGRLGDNHRNCVGLVKQLMTQHLRGTDAEVLYDLEAGYRTTAFRLISESESEREQGGRTHWYMRLWEPDGFEADHALVRIEAPNSVNTTDEIDEIASWIFSERIPRATDDPRWPTLLYPIHFLEKILKRRLASITTGWPS
jgi:hypothetical protein